MDVVIETTGNFRIKVSDVTHPVHAINRVKKYLRSNIFSVETETALGYTPEGEIQIDFDEYDIADNLDVEKHVTSPPVWLDKADVEQIVKVSWMLDDEVAGRLQKLIEEFNTV